MSQVNSITNPKRIITIYSEHGNCVDSSLIYACTIQELIYASYTNEKINKIYFERFYHGRLQLWGGKKNLRYIFWKKYSVYTDLLNLKTHEDNYTYNLLSSQLWGINKMAGIYYKFYTKLFNELLLLTTQETKHFKWARNLPCYSLLRYVPFTLIAFPSLCRVWYKFFFYFFARLATFAQIYVFYSFILVSVFQK